MRNLYVVANEFLDKRYGNTYFVVRVDYFYPDETGEIKREIMTSPMLYGYDNHYEWVAADMFEDMLKKIDPDVAPFNFMREPELMPDDMFIFSIKNENVKKREIDYFYYLVKY